MIPSITFEVGTTLKEAERQLILATLADLAARGVASPKTEAARVLGISVKTIYNKLYSYGWRNLKRPRGPNKKPRLRRDLNARVS